MARDATLIQIRERSYLDLLDLTMVVVRACPRTLCLAAAVGIAPFVVLNAWLDARFDLSPWLFLLLLVLEAPWATAPLTVVLGGMMFGERPRVGTVTNRLRRGLLALFVYQFLLRGLLAMTVVFYSYMPARLSFLNEVILLERGPFGGTMRRTSTLAGQRAAELFAQWLGDIVFGMLFILCFWIGTSVLAVAMTSSDSTWERPGAGDLVGLRFQLALWLAIAFFTVARFLTYIDQRIRLEGWEVKIRLQAVGRALEEEGRW